MSESTPEHIAETITSLAHIRGIFSDVWSSDLAVIAIGRLVVRIAHIVCWGPTEDGGTAVTLSTGETLKVTEDIDLFSARYIKACAGSIAE